MDLGEILSQLTDVTQLRSLITQNLLTIQNLQQENEKLKMKKPINREEEDIKSKYEKLQADFQHIKQQREELEEEVEYNVTRKDELKEEISDLQQQVEDLFEG